MEQGKKSYCCHFNLILLRFDHADAIVMMGRKLCLKTNINKIGILHY